MSMYDALLRNANSRGIDTGYERSAEEFARLVKIYVRALQKVGFSKEQAVKIFVACADLGEKR